MIKKRLMSLMGDSKRWIFLNILYKWLGLLCNVCVIIAVGYNLEQLLRNRGVSVASLCAASAAILARYFLIKKAADCNAKASGDIKVKLREALYAKLLRLPLRKDYSNAEVLQLSVEGIEQLDTYYSRYLPQFFYSLLAPLTLFAILAFFDIASALWLLLLVPLIPASIMVVVKFSKKTVNKYWSDYTRMGSRFLDNLQGLTTLKTYDVDQAYHEKMNVEAENFRRITMKVLTIQLNSVSVMDLMAYGSAAVGSAVALSGLASGRIGLMSAFCLFMLAAEFFIPLRLLGSYFHIAMNGMAASDRLFALMDISEEPQPEVGQEIKTSPEITAKGLCFAYGNEFALHDISLQFPKNAISAIVGESGCGKSSLTSLVRGDNSAYTGELLFDTVSARGISKSEFNRKIITVGSQSHLFSGTLRENLRMAKPSATDEEMMKALQKVNLWAEFASLDHAIQEQGANLSGGQKQRIAIARALLFDATVYIFDEATSGIDGESEEIIMRAIKGMHDKTVILISHRLYNVRDCARIFVLQQGRLIEQGTHDELMERHAVYCDLVSKQSRFERRQSA